MSQDKIEQRKKELRGIVAAATREMRQLNQSESTGMILNLAPSGVLSTPRRNHLGQYPLQFIGKADTWEEMKSAVLSWIEANPLPVWNGGKGWRYRDYQGRFSALSANREVMLIKAQQKQENALSQIRVGLWDEFFKGYFQETTSGELEL
jgi:hypothetical protein